MPDELVRRLRTTSVVMRNPGDTIELFEHAGKASDLMSEAAEAIDTLLAELKASIDQRERLIDAIKKSQAELRALQDMVIAPKDDGL